MSFETKNFKVVKKIQLPTEDFDKECEVELEGEVRKILSASTQVALSDYEMSEGEINYTADLYTCVVYMTDEGKMGSANAVCNFTGKISNPQIQANDKAFLSLTIKDTSVKAQNGNAVVEVAIELKTELFCQDEVKNIDCDDDDICAKKGNINVEKFIGEGRVEANTEEEFSAKANVKKVISLEPNIHIKQTECENGAVTVIGETITRIVYLTDDDKFESNYVVANFKEEIEVADAKQGMRAICRANIKPKDAVAEVLESDKGTKIAVKTPFVLNVLVFNTDEMETIEDMYSTINEINLASESFDMTKVCKTEVLEGKVDGNLTLGEDKPRVDKIVFNGGNVINITNAYISNGELFVEGIAKTTVVYLNDDENSLNSVEIEVPFALNDKVNADDNAYVWGDAVLFDTDVSVRRGRDLFFDGKVKTNVRICQDEVSATIVRAERGEPFEERDYAMQYVFGKAGENLWDIAKRNRIKEEQLVAQNPDAVFPLVQDSGFILFFQKTI